MDEELKKVIQEVESLVGSTHKSTGNPSTTVVNKVKFAFIEKLAPFLKNVDKRVLYSSTAIFVFGLLFLIKPHFLYVKDETEDIDKFSYKKLLIYTVIITCIIFIAYFALENSKFLRK